MATKLITLKQAQLFEVSTALAKAYRNTFSADTISRASQYVEGSKNPSRNYIWGIIMNTQGKAGKLCDVYNKYLQVTGLDSFTCGCLKQGLGDVFPPTFLLNKI